MQIHIRRADGVIVLRGDGRLVLGHDATTFRKSATRALAHCQVVALDLAGVRQIDAHGIGVLVDLYVLARDTGSALLLARVSDRVQRLLHVTGLDTIMPTVKAVTDADGDSRRRFGSAPARRHGAARRLAGSAALHNS